MAIKFSELRGLLKDTNINTVKMSDPAYSIQMEKITYGKNYIYTDNPKQINFNKLNYLKSKNNLWLVHQLTAFSIEIYLGTSPKVLNNTRIQVDKQMIYGYYKKAMTSSRAKDFWYLIQNCFSLDVDNTNILNPYLIKIQLYNNGKQPGVPNVYANKWYSGKWNPLNTVGTLVGYRGKRIHNFYNYELIDSDTNLRTSCMMYTNAIRNSRNLDIQIIFGYKPNDKFTKRYMSSLLHIEFHTSSTSFANKTMNLSSENLGTGSGWLRNESKDYGLYTPEEIEELDE